MKPNKSLFKKLIAMLEGRRVTENRFDMRHLDGEEAVSVIGKCGCVLYHAHRIGVMKPATWPSGFSRFYDKRTGVSETDFEHLFGRNRFYREAAFGSNTPTKWKVVEVFKNYLKGIKSW